MSTPPSIARMPCARRRQQLFACLTVSDSHAGDITGQQPLLILATDGDATKHCWQKTDLFHWERVLDRPGAVLENGFTGLSYSQRQEPQWRSLQARQY
jgi:hypothetical protein